MAVWSPFLESSRVNNSAIDWTYRVDYFGYQIHAIFQDHQFPLWVTSPRFEQMRAKGIHDFFANPETDVISVVTVFYSLGYLAAAKLALASSLAAGVYGCQRTLRVVRGEPPSLLAMLILALLSLCNGSFCAHVLVGHVQFITTAVFPLAIALFIEALDGKRVWLARARCAMSAGGILAIAYYAGNTHPLIHFLFIFVGFFTIVSSVTQPRRATMPLNAALVLGVSFVFFSAFKLLPGIADFHEYRRSYLIRFEGWTDLARHLITPWREMTGDNWQEHYMYIGWAGIALLAVAALEWRKRTLPFLVIAATVPWLMIADDRSCILALPVIRTQGVVTRFGLSVILAIAIAATVRIDEVLWHVRSVRVAGVRIGVIAALSLVTAFLALDLRRANVAEAVTISCRDEVPNPSGPFDLAPVFVAEDVHASNIAVSAVKANTFSYVFSQPNAAADGLVIATELPVTARWPHLKLSGEGELVAHNGLLAVRLKGRSGTFTLSFFDARVGWGLAISLLTCGLFLWLGQSRCRVRAG